MDMEWSKLVKLDHPWYRGVTLFTTSRGAEHNTKSYLLYLDWLTLARLVCRIDAAA